jgi:hypothetical protein
MVVKRAKGDESCVGDIVNPWSWVGCSGTQRLSGPGPWHKNRRHSFGGLRLRNAKFLAPNPLKKQKK